MDAKGSGSFDEVHQLTNLMGGLLAGYTHGAVKIALATNPAETLAFECRTPDAAEQQVSALATFIGNRIERALTGEQPVGCDPVQEVH